VVIVASVFAQSMVAAALLAATGVSARTASRWLRWWRGPFTSTEAFVAIRARLIAVATIELPASIVVRLGATWSERVLTMLTMLGPVTGGVALERSRVSRGLA
jgi:hypothetical protein